MGSPKVQGSSSNIISLRARLPILKGHQTVAPLEQVGVLTTTAAANAPGHREPICDAPAVILVPTWLFWLIITDTTRKSVATTHDWGPKLIALCIQRSMVCSGSSGSVSKATAASESSAAVADACAKGFRI